MKYFVFLAIVFSFNLTLAEVEGERLPMMNDTIQEYQEDKSIRCGLPSTSVSISGVRLIKRVSFGYEINYEFYGAESNLLGSCKAFNEH